MLSVLLVCGPHFKKQGSRTHFCYLALSFGEEKPLINVHVCFWIRLTAAKIALLVDFSFWNNAQIETLATIVFRQNATEQECVCQVLPET